MRFARLETTPPETGSTASALELVLRNGEPLRIGNEVDAAALRMVLAIVLLSYRKPSTSIKLVTR